MSKTCIILTGGKGTRLRPMTLKTPKPMLDIGGRPHLEHQVILAKEHGFDHVIFSAGYLHESIIEYFGNGSKFGIDIEYVLDGEKPLGTAGAIKNCDKLIRSNDFLVMNGDILTDIPLSKVYESHILSSARVTLTLTPVEDPTRFGVVLTDESNLVTDFLEKPKNPPSNYINAGIYVMNTNIFNSIPRDTYYMVETDVFPQYAGLRFINSYKSDSYWLDIGTPETYFKGFYDIWHNNVDTSLLTNSLTLKGNMYEGIMGKDFNFPSVVRLAEAISSVISDSVYLKCDDRFFSDKYYQVMEEVFKENDILVTNDETSQFQVHIGSLSNEPYINGIKLVAHPLIIELIRTYL